MVMINHHINVVYGDQCNDASVWDCAHIGKKGSLKW